MRIGVNARRLEGQRLGVGRYLEYVLKHWDQMLEADDQVDLFVRAPFDAGELGLSRRFAVHLLRPRLTGFVWENVHLPARARQTDVLFCPNYSAPLRHDGPMVVAIHSVNEVQAGAHPWWYKQTYTRIYRASARIADRVVVPSESTKTDLARHYGIDPDKIDIVEQGADESFHPIDDPAVLADTRRRMLGADVPYVLFVGKLSERRNIPVLLEGFARMKARTRLPHHLLLVGPNHEGLPLERLIERLNLAGSVVQTDGRFADHREIVPIYNAADVFVHPSLYEGFSMTTVEAFACGVPVIAANRGGLAEVARGYAHMINEVEPETVARALEEVLTDAAVRSDLRVRSRARGVTFRWQHTARKTLDVLRRVARQ
jgi:glycosyltransferase involved in cell wall biosynthesis